MFIHDHLCTLMLSGLVTMVSGIERSSCLSLAGLTLNKSNELLECGCQATVRDSWDEYAKIDFFSPLSSIQIQFSFPKLATVAGKLLLIGPNLEQGHLGWPSCWWWGETGQGEGRTHRLLVNSLIYWRTKPEQVSGARGQWSPWYIFTRNHQYGLLSLNVFLIDFMTCDGPPNIKSCQFTSLGENVKMHPMT